MNNKKNFCNSDVNIIFIPTTFFWLFSFKSFDLERSQGGQVGSSPDFYPGSQGLTPAQGNQQKKIT